jgi:cytochrome c biogenesis protein CcdA
MNSLATNPSCLLILSGGLAAGCLHVISGPDHLAAIAPLAIKKQRGAWLTGLRWGAGHASGVAVVGILSLLLRGVLPVDLLSSWSDRLVGVMLIGIGCWTLRTALRVHSHEHAHEGDHHVHIHVHGRTDASSHSKPRSHFHKHAAFGIGTLHGLAGSSHFLAIIPSLAMPSTALAILYLAAYGIGTVLAMILFSSTIHSLTSRFANAAQAYRGLMFACSAFAIIVGGCWLFGFSF